MDALDVPLYLQLIFVPPPYTLKLKPSAADKDFVSLHDIQYKAAAPPQQLPQLPTQQESCPLSSEIQRAATRIREQGFIDRSGRHVPPWDKETFTRRSTTSPKVTIASVADPNLKIRRTFSFMLLSSPGHVPPMPEVFNRRGEDQPRSVLKEKQIKKIRRLAKTGIKQKTLARLYGVNESTINSIVTKRTWRHVS